MSTALDFQSIIFKLQTYWAGQGCLIWQPYYSQVGAGTMNPATFLRVLGPEPWRVAMWNPQFAGMMGAMDQPKPPAAAYPLQVILKPDPQSAGTLPELASGAWHDPAQRHPWKIIGSHQPSPRGSWLGSLADAKQSTSSRQAESF